MNEPTVYNIDPGTGELTGSMPARLDPRATKITGKPVYLQPANSTLTAPPAVSAGQVPCWRDGDWVLIEDHRGETVYATDTAEAGRIDVLGPLPDDVTTKPRPSRFHTWQGGAWVEDGEAKRAEQVRGVKGEAGRRIEETYPDWAQRNMLARSIELENVKNDRDWTAAEEGEVAAFRAAWAWIKSVRATSDALEALDPIPDDFDADTHWPATP